MNYKYFWLFPFFVLSLLSSCAKDDTAISPNLEFSENELELISYFKQIALGFEFGSASEITRKWKSPMKVFLDGSLTTSTIDKVNLTISEINLLATDGFQIEIVNDSKLSNCSVFFGSASEFIEKFPDAESQIASNWGLFNVWWDNNNIINRARIFIDTNRPNRTQQESLILEEITQALGLGNDSPRFANSIFYETATDGGFATEYANIDKEIIRLLYHPDMPIGLNESQVDEVLKAIFRSEKLSIIN